MQAKSDVHSFKGLIQDLEPTKHPAEYLIDAVNIRINIREGGKSLMISSEKGSTEYELNVEETVEVSVGGDTTTVYANYTITGDYVGHCIINNYLVLFTASDTYNYIYRLTLRDNKFDYTLLYKGNLGYTKDSIITTLGSYENELVQKVYWTDGENQPKVINIMAAELHEITATEQFNLYNDNSFDFVQTLDLNEEVKVFKEVNSTGSFPAGCVQYSISYYNKYGQESNIVYTTPIFYTSFPDRAGSPEDSIGNAFRIEVTNIDTHFDYLRIYSSVRTSLDSTPTVKRVADIYLRELTENSITYVDTNTFGDTVDPTVLLYIGGEEIVTQSLCAKDGTLFMGNLEIKRKSAGDIKKILDKEIPLDENNNKDWGIYTSSRVVNYGNYKVSTNASTPFYVRFNSLETNAVEETDATTKYLSSPMTLHSNEQYRLGVQFQYKNGKWSEPIYMSDEVVDKTPSVKEINEACDVQTVWLPEFKTNLDFSSIINLGYKKVRPVIVLPTLQNRSVIAQGVLCPTVYSVKSRKLGYPYAQLSWFTRPFEDAETETTDGFTDVDKIIQWHHNRTLYGFASRAAEIQGVPSELSNLDLNLTQNSIEEENYYQVSNSNTSTLIPVTEETEISYGYKISLDDMNNIFAVDQSILTLHSPDVEWDDTLQNLDYTDFNVRIVGTVQFVSHAGDIELQTTATAATEGSGFIHRNYIIPEIESNKMTSTSLCAGLYYDDALIDDSKANNVVYFEPFVENSRSGVTPVKYMVYPWHKTGSLNNDIIRGANQGVRTSVLQKKIIANIKIANETTYKTKADVIKSKSIKLFNQDQLAVEKFIDGSTYYGNIDTLLVPPTPYGVIFGNRSYKTVYTYEAEIKTDSQTGDFEGTRYLTTAEIAAYEKDGTIPEWAAEVKKTSSTSFASNEAIDFNTTFLYTFDEVGLNSINSNNIITSLSSSTILKKFSNIGDETDRLRVSKDAIRMKYKSTPHYVIQLDNTDLETYRNENDLTTLGFLYLAEVYRDTNGSIYGEANDDVLKSHLWIPAGEPVSISSSGNTTIEWQWGDSFFQRYDCLRTYPFTQEDENQIIDIVSFMCESRVNCDGRYDRNRGQASNLYMSPLNFNLYNPVYSQLNNYFNYRILDDDYYKLSEYPVSLTWSTEKQAAQEIDPWTNVTMASMMDVDGEKGPIVALKSYADRIYCFQNKGISMINFNARVQIPTSDGVPVEITNNYKVDGKTYITESMGIENPKNVVVAPTGIYFVDCQSKDLFRISSANPVPVNISNGNWMSGWFKSIEESPSLYYDFNENNLYIKADNTVLCFSERLEKFESFFPEYYNALSLFNVKDKFFGITKVLNPSIDRTSVSDALFNGVIYSIGTASFGSDAKLLGTTPEKSSISFISSADAQLNKYFTNINVRGDWYSNGVIEHNTTFDNMRVYNEYQDTGTVDTTKYARKKFRVWRFNIPRALKKNDDNNRGRDRISNMWARVDFSTNSPFVLHDLDVTYYI